MPALEPIESYLEKLSARLPRRKRQNVLDELRRNLNDRVCELEAEGADPQAAAQQAVAEMGNPDVLAAEYGGGRVIIPATRYHIYKAAVIYVVSLHLVATIVATIMGLDVSIVVLRAPNLRGLALPYVIWTLATQALADVGLVTLCFWWADISLPRQLAGMPVRWRTAEAKPHWSGLAGPLIMLGLVNVWRDDIFALYVTQPGGWQHTPILAGTFVQTYLWPVNFVLLLALGVHTYKLMSGPTAPVAGAELIYRLAVFALTGAMLSFAQPFNLPGGQMDVLEVLLNSLFKLGLLAALFANAFAVYRAGARLAGRLR